MFRRIAVLLGAVFAVLAISMTPAHADGGTETTNGAGSVWFESYGEHVTVNDWRADGHGVKAWIYELRRGQGGQDTYHLVDSVYNGKGYHAGPQHANLSITDGHSVKLKVCLVDGSHDTSPSKCDTSYTTA